MTTLKSYSYAELEVGMQASFSKQLTERDIILFGETSGDLNPAHFDEEYASRTLFKGRIAHGLWSAGLISSCVAMKLPGPGSIYVGQDLKFVAPVRIDDTLTATLTIRELIEKRKFVVLDCQVTNQNDELVLSGVATVMPPRKSTEIQMPELPKVSVDGID